MSEIRNSPSLNLVQKFQRTPEDRKRARREAVNDVKPNSPLGRRVAQGDQLGPATRFTQAVGDRRAVEQRARVAEAVGDAITNRGTREPTLTWDGGFGGGGGGGGGGVMPVDEPCTDCAEKAAKSDNTLLLVLAAVLLLGGL